MAEVCRKSKAKARMAMSDPMMRIGAYGVPNLGLILAIDFGSCPFLAIANETLDKPNRLVRSTLVVAIRAPKEITPANVEPPTTLAASAIGELDCARIL
jgi:hypothetical protein